MNEQLEKSLTSQRNQLADFILRERELLKTLSELKEGILQLQGSVRALEYVKSLDTPDGVKV